MSDHLKALYEAASKGFHTSETCGPDGKYLHVSKFRSLDDLHSFEDAWFTAMLAARGSSLRQVPEVVDWRDLYRHQTAMRYMDSDSKITTQKADAMAFEDIARIERHHAASKPVDRMAAMIEHGMSGIDWTPEKASPAQAGAELVSHHTARVMLDSMDDYARMSVGVDAKGPRETLERYISQQECKA